VAALKKRINFLKKLLPNLRAQIGIVLFVTVFLLASFPVLAWFAYQRHVATVIKINSPAKLSIKAGQAEDIMQFKLSGIDVGDEGEAGARDYVFCVEGEDITRYNLQIAHTTNIDFTYTLYKAHTDPLGEVEYTAEDGTIVRYKKAMEFTETYGDYINRGTTGSPSNRKIGTTAYRSASYADADSRQRFAEPLYWQTKEAIDVNALDTSDGNRKYNEAVGSEKAFLNYYVLRISWAENSVTNDKETDMIYITAQVN